VLELIPSGGGAFEVFVDGNKIYSKLETGVFPDERVILDEVMERVA
jgi:selenoprotein W-related protein